MKLSLGARQLLTFLRRRAGPDGRCWWKQEKLARALDCDTRTIGRRVRELVVSGALQSVRKGHCNVYILCDLSCNVSDRVKPVENCIKTVEYAVEHKADGVEKSVNLGLSAVRSDQTKCPIGSPPVFITENNIYNTNPSSPRTAPDGNDRFRKAQREAVIRVIQRGGFTPTADLLDKLARKAAYYHRTGFEVAAVIERALRKTERSPSAKPRTIGWFLRVTENAFSGCLGATRRVMDGTVGHSDTAQRPPRIPPEFESSFKQLVNSRRLQVGSEARAAG